MKLIARIVAALGVAVTLGAQSPEDSVVLTHHRVTLDGRALSYTARAGRMPIVGDDGEIRAWMFFVSYTLDNADSTRPRPIVFAWNGGPGSNAGLVHLIGFGPRRIAPPAGARDDDESVRWEVRPNDGTWLDAADLVFVDPVGTGYSRVTRAEFTKSFYSTRGDAESVAQFIRAYRKNYNREGAPLFLAGESYGVTRASYVATLLQQQGAPVRGVVLLGLEPPVGALKPELRAALALPNYTLAAYVHKRLPPDLMRDSAAAMHQAESWAVSVWAPALANPAALSAAKRDSVVRQLARYTGLNPTRIDRKTLALGNGDIGNGLLRAEGKVVGLYDVRRTGARDTVPGPYDPRNDPSLTHLSDPIAMLRNLRDELGYHSDLNYQGPFGGAYPPPASFRGDWMSVKWDWKADTLLAKQAPLLETALLADTSMRALVACGLYDLICNYAANEHKVADLSPSLRRRITLRVLPGGHAPYTDADARLALRCDVIAFIRGTP